MATIIESDDKLKEGFKEDIAFTKAIAEGEQTPRVSRESVLEALEKTPSNDRKSDTLDQISKQKVEI